MGQYYRAPNYSTQELPLHYHLSTTCHGTCQERCSMHLNGTVQSIVIMSTLDQSPAFYIEFLLDTCCLDGPFAISDNSSCMLIVRFSASLFHGSCRREDIIVVVVILVSCTIASTTIHRFMNQRSTNEKALTLRTRTKQCR